MILNLYDDKIKILLTDEKSPDKLPCLYIEAPYYTPVMLYHGVELYLGPGSRRLYDMLNSRHCKITRHQCNEDFSIVTIDGMKQLRLDLVQCLHGLLYKDDIHHWFVNGESSWGSTRNEAIYQYLKWGRETDSYVAFLAGFHHPT